MDGWMIGMAQTVGMERSGRVYSKFSWIVQGMVEKGKKIHANIRIEL